MANNVYKFNEHKEMFKGCDIYLNLRRCESIG